MTSPREGGEPSLLRLYASIVLLVTLLTTAAGAAVALQEPVVYTSEARIQVLPVATRGAPIAPDMGTERELATSGTVAEDAAAVLDTGAGRALAGLSASVVTETAVLVLRYSASTPAAAYHGADAFARSYVEVRNSRQKARATTMITRPSEPHSSTGPALPLIFAVALLSGLALGLAAAWVWDRVANRVRSSRELGRMSRPVLAAQVSLPRKKIGITSRGLDDFAYLAGRLNAETRGKREDVRILVMAPRAGSGASAVALNVAAGISGLGRRVVLVDADFRSAGVSALLPGRPVPGLVELLNGANGIDETLRPLWLEGVRVVPSAVSIPPPQLDVDVTSLMLARLATQHIVVIDGPPLLEVPEAMLLADHVDVVLLVGDLRSLSRTDAARALELLEPLSAPLVGWVTHDRRTARREDDTDVRRVVTSKVGRPRPVSSSPGRIRGRVRPRQRSTGHVVMRVDHLTTGPRLTATLAVLVVLTATVGVLLGRQSDPSPQAFTLQPPPREGYLVTRPPGSWKLLPGDRACARRVHRSAWEPRPDNHEPNHRMADVRRLHASFKKRPRAVHRAYDKRWDSWLLPRVTGHHTGTTDEIFQWAACKWGVSDNLIRAIAFRESGWYQYEVYPDRTCVMLSGCGDLFTRASGATRRYCDEVDPPDVASGRIYRPGRCPKTYSIVGVMSWHAPQWGRMAGNRNGTFPFNRESTAFAVDYLGAVLRGCYEGWMTWLANTGAYHRGSMQGCVGAWYDGSWFNPDARTYVKRVWTTKRQRPWLQAGWARQELPCSLDHGCPEAPS